MAMIARDAAGRRVSLLNDESMSKTRYELSYRPAAPPSYYQPSARTNSSSPDTPELLRSDSYDSQMSNEPVSPMTPLYDYSRTYGGAPAIVDLRSSYEDYIDVPQTYAGVKRPGIYTDRTTSYEDDSVTSPGGTEKSAKRYPCRYRDSHGCDKSFTTSGHASRHSKIHTAEKAVPCSFAGCTKKFTRADNMKQHLDTHYKEKSRSSSSRPSLSPSSERRSSTSGKSSSRSKTASASSPLASPGGAWDMRGLDYDLQSRPSAARTPSGLDALAIACQELS